MVMQLLENGELVGIGIRLFLKTKSIVNKDGATIISTFNFYANNYAHFFAIFRQIRALYKNKHLQNKE